MNDETSGIVPDWAVFVRVAEDSPRARLERHIVAFLRRGAHYVRDPEVHRLRVLEPAFVLSALRAAGFTARSALAYGTFRMLPRRMAFMVKKSGRP